MGWAVLYIAFGIVALWLLGEVLFQYKARLRWRALAFGGFLCVVVGALVPSVVVIGFGIAAFATGQTFVTLSHRRGFVTGWALGGGPGTSRRRRGREGDEETGQDEYAEQDEYGEYAPEGYEGEAYGRGEYESAAEQTQVAPAGADMYAGNGFDPLGYEPDDVFTPGGYPAQTFAAADYADYADYTGNGGNMGNGGYQEHDFATAGYDQGAYQGAYEPAGYGLAGGYDPYQGPGGQTGPGGPADHDGFGAGQPLYEQPAGVYQPGPLPGETGEFNFGQMGDYAAVGQQRGGYPGAAEQAYDFGGQPPPAAGYADPYGGGYDAGGQYPGGQYGAGPDGYGGYGDYGQGSPYGDGYNGAPQDPYGAGYGTPYDGGYGGQQPYPEGAWVPQQRDTGQPMPPEQQPYPPYEPYQNGYQNGHDGSGNGYYYDGQHGY